MSARERALDELASLASGEGQVLVVAGADRGLAHELAARLGTTRTAQVTVVADLEAASGRWATVVLAGALAGALEPARLLRQARERLEPGGALVADAPNVAHGSLRLGLLAGRSPLSFDSSGRARGAWDRAGLESLFATAGLPIGTWRRTVEADFAKDGLGADDFPPALVRALRQDPEALTTAFVVKAGAGEARTSTPGVPERSSSARSSALDELRAGSLEVLDARAVGELHAVSRSLSFRLAVRFRDLSKVVFPLASLRGRAFWGLVDWLKRGVAGALPRRLGSSPAGIRRAGPTPDELRAECDRFLAGSERLAFPEVGSPRLSVLVVTFGKVEFTLRCLRALLEHGGLPFELTVVDNASSDATGRLLDRLDHVRVIRNTENVHFLKACNQAAREATAPLLLLLNNDAFVTAGAIPALVAAIDADPRAGAVAAKLVWPDGRLQEAGSILWSDGSAQGYGRGDDPARGEYGFAREIDFGSGAALLVRTATWRRLGGFDERFAPAYYEDADLCVAIRHAGERVLYEPEAVVVHNEFTSSSREAAAALCRRNQTVFADKWRAVLAARPTPSAAHVLAARDRRPGERVLVLDDRLPRPDHGAGYPRMFALVRALAQRGFVVTVVPVLDGAATPEELRALGRLGVEALHGPLDLARVLRERRGLVERVLVSRPHTAEVVFPLVRSLLPDALLVYDAEALFHERERERIAIQGAKPTDVDPERLRRSELALMARADRIVVVSERDAAVVARETGRPVHTWPHAVAVRSPRNAFADRRDLLFVGSFVAPRSPNEDAVVHFARAVLPRIQRELESAVGEGDAALPGVRLLVAGARPTDAVLELESDRVQVLGRVADLEELYERCRVFVNPLRFGAGISLKLLEAMANGIPAVASSVAARGLPVESGREVLVAATDDELAARIVQLYTDAALWTKVQRGGLEHVRTNLDPERLGRALDAIFAGARS